MKRRFPKVSFYALWKAKLIRKNSHKSNGPTSKNFKVRVIRYIKQKQTFKTFWYKNKQIVAKLSKSNTEVIYNWCNEIDMVALLCSDFCSNHLCRWDTWPKNESQEKWKRSRPAAQQNGWKIDGLYPSGMAADSTLAKLFSEPKFGLTGLKNFTDISDHQLSQKTFVVVYIEPRNGPFLKLKKLDHVDSATLTSGRKLLYQPL